MNVNDRIADRIYLSTVNSIREDKLMKKEHPVKNCISFLFRKFSKKSQFIENHNLIKQILFFTGFKVFPQYSVNL